MTGPGEMVQNKKGNNNKNKRFDKRLLINQKGCMLQAAF